MSILFSEDSPLLELNVNHAPVLAAQPYHPITRLPKMEYELGDICWVHADDYNDKLQPMLTQGKVVGYLDIEGNPERQYIIKLEDPKYIHLEIRDSTIMTDDPTVLPVFWPPIILPPKGVIESRLI